MILQQQRAAILTAPLRPTWSWDFRTGSLPSGATFARASTATYFDASGVLRTAGSGVARFDHDPATGIPLGYLAEPQSTNGVRNNTMIGASAGTPGMPPTNWTIGGLPSGVSSTIAGVGTVNGMSYIDIRIFGTAVGGGGGYVAVFDTSSGIAASVSQVWTTSAYLALIAGSFANVTGLYFDNVEYPGGHDNGNASFLASITSSLKRLSTVITILNSGTTNVQPRLAFLSASNAAVDFTLRIGLPQIEQLSGATSPILTNSIAATRAQDLATLSLTSVPGWNASKGGVLVATYRINSSINTGQYIASIDNGTFQNTITIKSTQGGGISQGQMVTANFTQFSINGGSSPVVGAREKAAIGWSTLSGQFARNGGPSITSSGSYALPSAVFQLGFGPAGGGCTGTLESVAYYVGARSDAFVQQVSR